MTADSQWPLQQGLHAALSGDAALQALLGDPARIFDQVPQDSAFPYLVIGEDTTGPFDTKTEAGLEHRLTIHSWSPYPGLKEPNPLLPAIPPALDPPGRRAPGPGASPA